MKFICDLHIHSRFARATSKSLTLPLLHKWAKKKGILVLGTGDFTHPVWIAELKAQLEQAEPGLYALKGTADSTRFVFTSEVSCIYSQNGAVRRVHMLIFAPSLEVAETINKELGMRGNLHSDGRPILGLSAKEVTRIALAASEDCMIVPAHIWTPWFAVFGSKSGFNSLQECFQEYTKYIYAVETGLSSDPSMNWRLSQLDSVTLLSNSDSHSAPKIGREVNVFNTELSYEGIMEAIRRKDPARFLYTVEFFPEEGKYHYDGHRVCNVRMKPKERIQHNGICPVCHKQLTVGVLSRVEELADRPEGFCPPNAIPYKKMIPLQEIIAYSMGVGVASKRVQGQYEALIEARGNEFDVLLDASLLQLQTVAPLNVAQAIIDTRKGKVKIEPGYDGEFGAISIT